MQSDILVKALGHNDNSPIGILAKIGKLESKRVHEGVRIGESNDVAGLQWLPSFHQAIIIRNPLEDFRVHHSCRGKPTTVEVNI